MFIQKVLTKNWCLFALLSPFVFTLHGLNESFSNIDTGGFFYSLSVVIIINIAFWGLGMLLYRHLAKAIYFAFTASLIVLLYPVDQDASHLFSFLQKTIPAVIVIIISISLVLILLKFITVSRTSAHKYLNLLFVILLITELIHVCVQFSRHVKPSNLLLATKPSLSQSFTLPSVFVILFDEYAGVESLRETAGYNNTYITDSLKSLGFHLVPNSRSNYDYTILSVASMLNGDYNESSNKFSIYDDRSYKSSLLRIYNNNVFPTFKEMGYNIINLSPIDVRHYSRFYKSISLPGRRELILQPTILDELTELLPLYITRRLPDNALLKKTVTQKTNINYTILDSVLNINSISAQPVFCYAHIMMPHAIYAKDSMGNINTSFLINKAPTKEDRQNAYVQYLIHTNKTLLPFFTTLMEKTKGKAIILAISDHGSRDLHTNYNKSVPFNNLIALYKPDGKYDDWYSGMSNVNLFRILFANLTGKQIPLVGDSLIFE
jgi:hypothetical protein